ncbi:hypothetical protein CcaverHIS002_0411270 [Cutaneotrichosporon cavernicola]|uniref:Uncharacterized protein n=1 Tax=Cutaneotrichosporon cavernicola TaxID=279322 RepID=A0AA48QWE3_9TREE|nr:uncharacterized protein CcaverHIS019_0411180 [Cutaneotrichosporon cavernicola]BEI84523.1 hypothetical protein CcaverHIS002_0411270 [Cutaneotrichosporon cavernicola]BEI92298.1 hypothetical protein CcaverHIS019_0411180 [Cutaneotrichosporon cavernicola]BEJ00069.1 hypothetical protein CcaverHIS631_0411110 [Cutaneotrichosporon cavernicola]BEJ07842.1 hypothetical protein CcaverHIS641_0411110 [Cutaneotrichosporon cavernicola]
MTSPPKYGSTNGGEDASSSTPLLGQSSAPQQKGMAGLGPDDFAAATLAAQAGSSRNAWMDQPAEDDIPDDFKIGVVVADCDEAIRRAFIRKVYAILLCQLGLTAAVSGVLMLPGPGAYVQNNPWIIIVSVICSFISLFGVYWKRHNYPANMLVLTAFTFFESIMIGTTCSFYDAKIVMQALIITTGVFVGFTLFTFQTKLDFSSFGPFLFGGLMGLITAGLVGIFIPFGKTTDLVIACIGVLVFSGFVLYDTQNIMKRLSVDEAILASLSLYLDFLNLFLYILRILNNSNND